MSTVAHIRGRIAGAAILTLFGCVWWVLALAFWVARPVWSMPAGFVATVVLLGLCVLRLLAIKDVKSVDDPVAAAKGKRAGILFGIIFGAEGGLIALCAALLGRAGLSIWVPIATGVIVGLHFIPLARLFEVPIYYWTGTLSVLGVLACSLVRDIATRQLCAGLLMASVLWLTAVVIVLQGTHPEAQQA
jgi:hypothetical protein